ncbi:hypothetical protein HYV64_02285 [Candidatus Shapirobacteria bacterium]|nr:hypothetical protein [Candidatus Shapirobacteria bacterium]
MGNLKINVSVGDFKVELEGDSSEVISQFNQIKQDGIGKIADVYAVKNEKPISFNPVTKPISTDTVSEVVSEVGTMTLFDLARQNKPQGETEWVLIYAFYITKEGKDTLTRKEIIDKYAESRRKTPSKIKNLSASLNNVVKNKWLSQLNGAEYVVTDDGKRKALEIISRDSGTAKLPKKKTKKSKVVADKNQ